MKIRLLIILMLMGLIPVIFSKSESRSENNIINSRSTILQNKFSWIKTIPCYSNYFDTKQKGIIEIIGIDNYLILCEKYENQQIYFTLKPKINNYKKDISSLIGKHNYNKLYNRFPKYEIYFNSLRTLKKAWSIKNKHIDPKEASQLMGVSPQSIYRWRNQSKDIME